MSWQVRQVNPSHLDIRRSVPERVSLLLEQMRLREKCFQLTSVAPWNIVSPSGGPADDAAEFLAKSPGHVSNFALDDPGTHADVVGRIQRAVVEGTRLGIPVLIHAEALNGFLSGGHMVFPTPTGLAATWSPDLVEEMADVIRGQMRRVGVRQALSPVMDVALDPRWGRFHETYGEDPYLSAALSVAYTRGLQSDDLARGVIATAKHFLGYGLPESGINLSAFEAGARRTRDLFAFPFEAAIQLGGPRSVMNSYADVDGVPAAASREVLHDLLRATLGFTGFVSSDYMTLEHLVTRQRVAATPGEAAQLTIRAGLDCEFPFAYGYGDALAAEVEKGTVDVEDVDLSVARVLTAKFELGLFENPYPSESIDLAQVATEGQDVSQELARRSVVLAKNDGILPLAQHTLKVAVIGPHADAVKLQFPTYTYPAFREMTVYMSSGAMGNMVGIDPGMAAWNEALLPSTTTEELVRSTLGATSLSEAIGAWAASTTTTTGSTLLTDLDDAELAHATQLAEEADVVVLALGGASLWFNGERTEGEASDSADISLPAAQTRLAEAVAAAGKPVVAVLFQGRPYALPPVILDASAIVIAPYGGPFGPASVAEVLFGAVNPSGKLPYTVPRHTGQVPIYHHQKAGTGYRNPLPPDVDELYLDMPATPQFPFGHGLSYTRFELTELDAAASAATDGEWRASIRVSNVGELSGATAVQLYARVNALGVTRPAQQLLGFARVELAAGESRTVEFTVDASQFAFTGLDHRFSVEPCRIDYFIGIDSGDRSLSGWFELQGERRVLAASERVFLTQSSLG